MKDSDTKIPYRREKRKVSYGSFMVHVRILGLI